MIANIVLIIAIFVTTTISLLFPTTKAEEKIP